MIEPSIPSGKTANTPTNIPLIVNYEPEERYDRITRLAARLFNVPFALICVIDNERQWFKSVAGLNRDELPEEAALCDHTFMSSEPLVVSDTLKDERFFSNPLVASHPHIRFYAGCPLITPEGELLGTLCIMDRESRLLSSEDLEALLDLTGLATSAFMEESSMPATSQEILNRLNPREATKSDFLADAAHELRTPIASVLGFSELLLNNSFDAPTQKEMLSIIFEESSKLIRLINALLDLARIESQGTRTFDIHPQPLSPIIEAALASLTFTDAHPVEVHLDENLPLVNVDENKLQLALTQILTNSLNYSPDGGAISISATASPENQTVELRIQDQGLGMSPDQAAQIFERFYRAYPEIPGNGLGMAIVKAIMDVLGGSVEVQSRLTEGTEVKLLLQTE